MGIETVAVAGGNGRIGRAVIEELREHGYRTINLDRQDKYATEQSRENLTEVADEYLTVDLLDAGEVYGALTSSDSDALIHMGTIRGPTNYPGHVVYESNVMTTYHLLEASREIGLEAVCLPSSVNAMGSVYQSSLGIFSVDHPIEVSYLPVDENHPLSPRDPYALGKHCIEVTADGFGRLPGPPARISSVRFPWVLFAEEMEEMFAQTDRTLDGLENPPEWMAEWNSATTRDVLFSYLHVRDAARVARMSVEADFEGHERFWAVADDTTADVGSSRLAEEYFPRAEKRESLEGFQSLISIEKAEEMLGWIPQYSWRS